MISIFWFASRIQETCPLRTLRLKRTNRKVRKERKGNTNLPTAYNLHPKKLKIELGKLKNTGGGFRASFSAFVVLTL